MIKAPWTPTQVKNLTERQQATELNPYTCQCSARLVPMTGGWFCAECDCVMQDWAHTSDVTGQFKDLIAYRKKLDAEIDAFLAEV